MLWPDLDDQSLWIALAASALAHALALATLTGAFSAPPAFDPGAAAKPIPIQVVLVQSPAPAVAREPEVMPASLQPPEESRPETASKPAARTSASAVPIQGGQVTGRADPVPSIAVGQLVDSQAAGPAYALDLALRFPVAAARMPQLRGSLVVAYPPEALRAHEGKRVVALLTLDGSGAIIETKLSPDDSAFGPAVMSALKDAQFAPASIGGAPVPYWVLLEFTFSVDATEIGPVPPRASAKRGQPSVGR